MDSSIISGVGNLCAVFQRPKAYTNLKYSFEEFAQLMLYFNSAFLSLEIMLHMLVKLH
jgi:hypothetical protein